MQILASRSVASLPSTGLPPMTHSLPTGLRLQCLASIAIMVSAIFRIAERPSQKRSSGTKTATADQITCVWGTDFFIRSEQNGDWQRVCANRAELSNASDPSYPRCLVHGFHHAGLAFVQRADRVRVHMPQNFWMRKTLMWVIRSTAPITARSCAAISCMRFTAVGS